MQPRTFVITAPAGEVKLNDSRKGEVTYTVTNESERPQRALARITPLDGAKQEWFSVTGELERELPVKGTQQYLVRIEVPSTVPEGAGKFRLDMVSAGKGTESYGEGPTVVFRIPEAKKKESLLPWIIAGAAVLLVVGGVIAWILLKGNEVPGVEGKFVADARTALAGAELTLAISGTGYDSTLADSTVISQDPKGGSKIPDDKTVRVTVNTLVPSVEGKPIADARTVLAGSGLTLAIRGSGYDSNAADSSVLSQDPKSGSKIPDDKRVSVTINTRTVPVPHVRGQAFPAAVVILAERGLVPDLQRRPGFLLFPEYTVLGTVPDAGTIVRRGDRITVYYSVRGHRPVTEVKNYFDSYIRERAVSLSPQRRRDLLNGIQP